MARSSDGIWFCAIRQRTVACSRLAACIIGDPLSHLLVESYDNRPGIRVIRERNPKAKIAIFLGTDDEVIPVRMGRELAREFPFVDFLAVDGANHVGVLSEARDKIIQWMGQSRAIPIAFKAAPCVIVWNDSS